MTCFIFSFKELGPLYRVQRLYGADVGGFACGEEAGQGACHNEGDRSLQGDVQIHRRIGKHGLLEHARIHRLSAEVAVHQLRDADTCHHPDVAKQGGDDNALRDD